MNASIRRARLLAAASATLILGTTACLDYTFETTVNADGSGARVERMEVVRNEDTPFPEAVFRGLTSAGEGWRTSTRVDGGGDTTWVLERRAAVAELGDWADVQRPLIRGADPARAGDRIGYVRLGDVVFRNAVQVGVSRRSDGTSVVSYREVFTWDQAADALVEFVLRDLDATLQRRYPRLTEGERGAILGYTRARIAEAGEEGLFAGENEDEVVAVAVERSAAHAVRIVRVRHPDADDAFLRSTLTSMLALEDDQVEGLFRETLPGLELGFNTSVTFRLRMPGEVTTTNAESRSGSALEWTFSPLDDLTRPLELFAESVVRR